MRGKNIIVIGFLLIPLLVGAQNVPQTDSALIEGRVTDEKTGEPLHGAHVFLSGTTIGTVTDYGGNYRLHTVPPGVHRLVVSMIGFGGAVTELIVSPGELMREEMTLSPVVYEMEEIYVGNLDEKWEKHLDRFTQLFIGKTERSDSVTILNPEVLRFSTRWWGRFTAEALAPLQIENHSLGYHITFYLTEFRHSGNLTRWDGEPLFRELTPSDSAEAALWAENREKAFSGSFRHFLIAMVEDRLEEEGFVIYTHRRNIYGGSSAGDKLRTRARRLIRQAEEDEGNLYNMRFHGRLEIVYNLEEEEPGYVRWARDLRRGPSSVQTSYLELNEWPVTIDTDGEMLEPYGATQYGYFAYQRIADITPREFRNMNHNKDKDKANQRVQIMN